MLAACIPTTYLKDRPVWGADCVPSNTEFLVWAGEIERLDAAFFDEVPHDPVDALAYCTGRVIELGYKFAEKPKSILGEFGRFTTTVPLGFVWLDENWSTKSTKSKAGTMCHELVHVYTEVRLGLMESASFYASDEGRFAFELTPYAKSFEMARWFGSSEPAVLRRAGRTVKSLHDGYYIQIPPACMKTIAFEYWGLPRTEATAVTTPPLTKPLVPSDTE